MVVRLLGPVVVGALLGCGGQRVGDEGYFAGEPLPPPEKPRATASAPLASSVAPDASAPSICDTPPPGGFPNCNADKSNQPCLAAGIGECFLHCGNEPPRAVSCQPGSARP